MFRFRAYKSSACQEKQTNFRGAQPKGSLVQRELSPKVTEGLFCGRLLLLQSLRLATQATSLYTREAHHRPIVHLKGVTHYTLRGKACEKEYEQTVRTPFVIFFGRCCSLRVILGGVRPRFHLRFARCCFAVRLRYASLRMTRRTQSKPEGRTAMPFGSRREIKTCFMEDTACKRFFACKVALR